MLTAQGTCHADTHGRCDEILLDQYLPDNSNTPIHHRPTTGNSAFVGDPVRSRQAARLELSCHVNSTPTVGSHRTVDGANLAPRPPLRKGAEHLFDADVRTVRVLVGLDCDRPRSEFAHMTDFAHETIAVGEYLIELFRQWTEIGIGWTTFLCGGFLNALTLTRTLDPVVRAHERASDVCEIACHTYLHRPLGPVPGRPELQILNASRLSGDLILNDRIIREAFGKIVPKVLGLRAPYGTTRDSMSNAILSAIVKNRAYVSSWTRGGRFHICPPLVEEGLSRQPFRYPNGLTEIPGHGWHDTVFAGHSLTTNCLLVNATKEYRHLLKSAGDLARMTGKDVTIGLSLHPSAMRIYDPQMRLLPTLLGLGSKSLKYRFLPYIECARKLPQK